MTSRASKQPALPGMAGKAAAKKPTPKYVIDKIKAEHPEAFGHKAHYDRCRRCHALTLRGYDLTEDFAGEGIVDLTRLDTMTELEALKDGRRTYEVKISDTAKTLRSRDQWRIRAHAPETLDGPVMPAHKCNNRIGQPFNRSVLEQGNTP